VSLKGTVRGTNEDGPTKQDLEGEFIFDLDAHYLSALTLRGRHYLLDPRGREAGRVEGRFVLTRQANFRSQELSDQALRGVTLEPTAANTRLLYENTDLGLSFLYPRRWRVSGVQGRQVTLDGADGSGLMLTVDPPQKLPTGRQFLAESQAWLQKKKGRVLRVLPPQAVQAAPSLERFGLEVEMDGQRFWMDYFIARQTSAGATIAARLPPKDLAALQKEVDGIARSVRLSKRLSAP
jgi:hypothetical protein